jgi:hypothetical protein
MVTRLLNRGAWHGTIRAEHTTITVFRLDQGLTLATFMVDKARIRRHCHDFGKATMRTSQYGFSDDLHDASRLILLPVVYGFSGRKFIDF